MLGNLDVGLLPVAGRDFLEVDWMYFYGVFLLLCWLLWGFCGGKEGNR